ncbi:MAG: TrkA family potassium uptake protein [bacterium]
MYIIIVGAGNLGEELVSKITMLKKDVVVIDRDKDACDKLFAQYGIETIHGDGSKLSVLRSAGIGKADMLISTIRKDDVNLAISVLAKSLHIDDIIVLMRDKSYMDAYKTSGATKILNIVDTLVEDIIYSIEKPAIRRVASLKEGAVEVFILEIPEKGKITGKTISEIASDKRMPLESIIAGIYNEEENEFKIPRGNTKIPSLATLFVLTKPNLIKKTTKVLMET